MDWKGLAAFLQVVEQKTVRGAAEALSLTPSAVSQTLSNLEKDLGVTLFLRDVRPLRLTPAGRRLFEGGRQLLSESRRLRARVASDALSMQSLRLGLGESVSATMSPWLVHRLYQNVASLEVYSALTHPLTERLKTGTLDVIVCAGVKNTEEKWLRRVAYEEEFLLVRTKSAPSVDTLDALRTLAEQHPFIGYNGESSDQIRVNRLLDAGGVTPVERMTVSSSYTLVGLIAQTGGFGILPPANLWCGRQFLSDVVFERLPKGLRERRRMWVVGEADRSVEQVEFVCSLVRTVLRENMLSAFRSDAPGLEAFVTCPSESS